MFTNTRSLLQLTTVVVALAANACAAHGVRPVESAGASVSCVGGVVESAADAALYGNCERVNGDLRISAPELSDLAALAALRSVSGTLEIAGNSQLDNLAGLADLEHVGALAIHDNQELDALTGLGKLHEVSRVVISDNPELGSLRGLEGLTRVGSLTIDHNGLYQTVGLSNLTDVGDLLIESNAKLNGLQGLGALAHARSVEIRNNPRLCAHGMLPALAHVDHALELNQNRAITAPEVRRLMGRIEHGFASPASDGVASLETSLR